MGCFFFKQEALKKINVASLKVGEVSVEVFTGNPFDEKIDSLLVLTNDLVKFDLKVLNKESIYVLEKCFHYLGNRKLVKNQLKDEKVLVVKGRNAEKVVFAAVPWYIDGTLGEVDSLEQAMIQAFSVTDAENVCIYIDCVYPKTLFVKEFLKLLENSPLVINKRKLMIYSNNVQIVRFIQRYLLNIYSQKKSLFQFK